VLGLAMRFTEVLNLISRVSQGEVLLV